MHILIIASYYPTQDAPVTGIFFRDQVEALRLAGHQVGVIVTPRLNVTLRHLRGGGRMETMTRDPWIVDYPVYRMHWGWFPRFAPPVIAPLIEAAGVPAYQTYVRAHGRPDVIHADNIFYGGYLAARLKARFHVPVVLFEVSSSFVQGRIIFPMQPRIIRHALRQADARFVCGTSLIEPLHRYAPGVPLTMIGCVIDTDFFTPGSPPAPASPLTFVVIAQLKEKRKGFDVLLDSFAAAFAGRDDVHLLIRGHGPLRPQLDAQIAQLGIGDKVEFIGLLNRDELRALIRRSHVLLSSSYVETFGVSVAEAMACGKPVVATRSGGPEDFVTPNSGLIVEPGNRAAFADALRRIADTHTTYDPNTVRADIVGRFSAPVYVAALEAAYRQSIG